MTSDTTPTPQMLLDELPARFRPEVAGTTKALIQLDLSGDDGGLWWVRIAHGRCTVGAGPVDKPDVQLIMSASDYVRIRLGQLDPIAAAMPGGPMRVVGKYGTAIKFAKLFRTA
ncbi:MAG TPA: SCP2 sterol-binding domain-containing protein [Streptosporangiaceae bacterium]|nr:SCP2 sterol-binding domain-containing protein [Streptosporangiaceae bacterium]